jgi:hypothetical protein
MNKPLKLTVGKCKLDGKKLQLFPKIDLRPKLAKKHEEALREQLRQSKSAGR